MRRATKTKNMGDVLKAARRLRNEYSFERTLTPEEREFLTAVIGWRRGSHVCVDTSGAVIGCIGHPDDLEEFCREVRKRGERISVRVAVADCGQGPRRGASYVGTAPRSARSRAR